LTPYLAALLWLISLVALLAYDPARKPGTVALWIPTIWLVILGSRLPSQWLGGGGYSAEALTEGNPVDRTIFLCLIFLSIALLAKRRFQWGVFFSSNPLMTLFLSYALLSVIWSDFPFVTFKRWFRDLGNYLVVLVPLAERAPTEAIVTVLRRLFYLLIPVNVLIVKYFPDIGRQFDPWSGAGFYCGAATSKNVLGIVCLISGLLFFWDALVTWGKRKEKRMKRLLAVDIAFVIMTLWLLNLSNSATSRLCLGVGCLVIVVARTRFTRRNPTPVKVLIPICFLVYLMLSLGFNFNAMIAQAVGRDPTLTHRTEIWGILVGMHTNPILGVGYETFWLGDRLDYIWRVFAPGLNEAHNGYLEMYLNLGLVGVLLLMGFLLSGYKLIWRRVVAGADIASLNLAVWSVMLFYNMTEVGFRSGLMWLTVLFGMIRMPARPSLIRSSFAFTPPSNSMAVSKSSLN